jgi:enoyl-CoA hydratase
VTNLVEIAQRNSVLHITLQRPEKRNALSRALLDELAQAFQINDDGLSLAVLTGAGHTAFASGGDLHELDAIRTEAEAVQFSQATRGILDLIRNFQIPVVAVLNGDALGGGAELALACDMRIARSHAGIGFLQSQLNISTSWGGGADLFDLLPPSRAMQVLCTAQIFRGDEALRLGLVDVVATGDDEDTQISALIARLAGRKPQVMRAFKALRMRKRAETQRDDRLVEETKRFAQTWVHQDHWTAVESFMKRGK